MAFSKVKVGGLADDSVTAAKIDDDGTGFTVGNLSNSGTLQQTGQVTLGTGGTNWTLPTARGTNKYVLQIQGGASIWAESLTAPEITVVTGNLNAYEAPLTPTGTWSDASTAVTLSDGANVQVGASVAGVGIANGTTVQAISGTALTLSQNSTAAGSGTPLVISKTVAETMGGTLTITGTNIGNTTSELTVVIQRTDGTKVTTASRVNSANGTSCVAQWFGNEANYSTFGNNETIFVKVTKSGLGSNTISSGKKFTTDPLITSEFAITQSGGDRNTATSISDSVMGAYGSGKIAGGGDVETTALLLNFDRGGGVDFEDRSNQADLQYGHKITADGNAVITSSPFGDGKSAMYFDGSNDKLEIADHADWDIVDGDYTVEFWLYDVGIANNDGLIGTQDGSGLSGWAIRRASGELNFNAWGGSSVEANVSSSGAEIGTSKTWRHIAFVRHGDFYKLYIDGINNGSVEDDTPSSLTVSGTALKIGVNYASAFSNCYIDEIRIVKGVAVYTGNFTVPTSRLAVTQNAGTNISAITGTATKLLIHSNRADDASNFNHSLVLSNGIVQNTTQARATWGGSSWGFADDNSNHHINVAAGPDWNFGNSDFTLEWWAYNLSSSRGLGYETWTGANGGFQSAYVNTSGYWATTLKATDGTTFSHSHSVDIRGGWHHFAISRNGTKIRLFLDGTRLHVHDVGTKSFGSSTLIPYIGRTDVNSYGKGQLEDLRVVKGTGVYSEGFTAPTGPLTTTGGTYSDTTNVNTSIPNGHTKLLIAGDGAKFEDSATGSGTIHVPSVSGSFHSQGHKGIAPALPWPASSKVNGSSGAYFDGSSFLIVANSTDLSFSNNDFTIEFWIYHTGQFPTSPQYIFDKWDSGKSYAIAFTTDLDTLTFLADRDGTHTGPWDETINFTSTGITANVWYHVAFAKNNTDMGLYVNGKFIAKSTALAGDTLNTTTDTLRIGRGDNKLYGYLDDIRISNGIRQYHGEVTSEWSNFTDSSTSVAWAQPTKPHGAFGEDNPDVGTITLTSSPSTNATTGTLTNGAASVTSITTTNVRVGDRVTGTGIASGTTTVSSITTEDASNGGTLVLSANSTATGSQTLTFTPEIAFSEQGSTLPTGLSLTDGGAGANTATVTGTMTGTAGTASNLRIRMQANGDAARISEIHESSGVGALSVTKTASGKPVLFNARRYLGNGSTTDRKITGFGFQPDFLIVKNRQVAEEVKFSDSVRGAKNILISHTNAAQVARSNQVMSLDPDGFSIRDEVGVNQADKGIIGYGFKAGGAPSASALSLSGGVGAGTIANGSTNVTAITQSVNQNSGLSITKYTGGATGANQTSAIPHNLGGTPDFIIVKNLSGTYDWVVYHKDLATDKNMNLNNNTAEATKVRGYIDAPDSTNINLHASTSEVSSGFGRAVNANGDDFICYAFKAVAGVSAFGKYEGTGGAWTSGNDGGAQDVGFKPRFIIHKNMDAAGSWEIKDAFRGENGDTKSYTLWFDQNNAENSDPGYRLTLDSNGWKNVGNHAGLNTNNQTYIYVAFA